MANFIDSKMTPQQQEQATRILQTMNVDNLTVKYENKSFVFERDRRVVTIPLSLIEGERWSDIRFLFRAILNSENSLWNRAAEANDWSGKYHYKS